VNLVTRCSGELNSNAAIGSRLAGAHLLHTRLQGGNRVLARYCALVSLIATLLLTGCAGNYRFNDADYRPLGEPQSAKRAS
jgi:hypothetical protein